MVLVIAAPGVKDKIRKSQAHLQKEEHIHNELLEHSYCMVLLGPCSIHDSSHSADEALRGYLAASRAHSH